jgi:hypothetical protein
MKILTVCNSFRLLKIGVKKPVRYLFFLAAFNVILASGN